MPYLVLVPKLRLGMQLPKLRFAGHSLQKFASCWRVSVWGMYFTSEQSSGDSMNPVNPQSYTKSLSIFSWKVSMACWGMHVINILF